MTKGKKYDYRVVQDDSGWSAEIVRRITTKKSVVSKSQGGFASEAEAREWGQREMQSFLQSLGERNRRHSRTRREKAGVRTE